MNTTGSPQTSSGGTTTTGAYFACSATTGTIVNNSIQIVKSTHYTVQFQIKGTTTTTNTSVNQQIVTQSDTESEFIAASTDIKIVLERSASEDTEFTGTFDDLGTSPTLHLNLICAKATSSS